MAYSLQCAVGRLTLTANDQTAMIGSNSDVTFVIHGGKPFISQILLLCHSVVK